MSTDTKVITLTIISTAIVLVGAIIIFSKDSATSVPPQDAITTKGLHWHPKLTIAIDGEKQELGNKIGLTGSIHQEMHTHDEDYKDDVVHMEMQGLVTKDETRLGRFFQIWGKSFSSKQIFDKINGAEGEVRMIVNGKVNNEFENYEMKDNDLIEIIYE